MADYVVLGLTKRRAELAGEMQAIEARLAQIATDIGHLDAVIHQFDPDYSLASIRPKRPAATDKARRGEMSRFILGVLREAPEPLSVAAITHRMMETRGMDLGDAKRVRQITKRVAMTLRHQAQQGTVRAAREPGQPAFWGIAS